MLKTCLMISASCVLAAGLLAAEIPPQATDQEILSVLSMIDQNEIHAAQLAQQKNIGHVVLDYARMLDRDHNAHLDSVRKLTEDLGLTAADNQAVEDLRTRGQKDVSALTALDGLPFSQLYIADMIKGHSEALNWIEGQEAKNARIKDLLNETKSTIAAHFKEAQRIQQAQTGDGGTP